MPTEATPGITTLTHKHYKMGTAPYRLMGVWSMPTIALAEANPSAYNAEMARKPQACRGSCDHCGTGIIHHYLIQDAQGQLFAVGSSCIEKLGDIELVTALQLFKQEQRREEREAKKLARFDAYQAELEAQRARNGGYTDDEMQSLARRKEEREKVRRREDAVAAIERPLRASGNFGVSIVDGFLAGHIPTDYALKICVEILAKQHGRKNSKAYIEALPAARALVQEAIAKIKEV